MHALFTLKTTQFGAQLKVNEAMEGLAKNACAINISKTQILCIVRVEKDQGHE